MVTINKDVLLENSGAYQHDYELKGLSTDSKPTANIYPNSLFLELDTGDVYYWSGTEWAKVGA